MLKIESYRKGVLFSSGLNLVGQAFGFLSNILLAYYFGTRADTDIYYYLLSVMTLLAGFFSSLNSSVLIPESMRLAVQRNRAASMAFLNLFLYLFVFLSGLGSCLMLSLPVPSMTLISRFDALILQQHLQLVVWSIPVFSLLVLSQYLVDILTSQKFFTFPVLCSILTRVLVVGGVVLFHARLAVMSALMGTLLALILQVLVSLWIMRRRLCWDFSVKGLKMEGTLFRNLGYAAAANLLALVYGYAPLYLISGFSGGVLTALNYAQRVAALPLLLFTAQSMAVVGIRFNELYAQAAWTSLDRLFRQVSGLLLLVMVPGSFFLALFAEEWMRVLFFRGAFDERSVELSALFFRILVLALPASALNTVLARLFMAAQKMSQAFWCQVLNNLIGLLLLGIGVGWMGASGYPLALLVLGVGYLLVMWWIMHRLFPFVGYAPILAGWGCLSLVNLLLCGGMYVLKQQWGGGTWRVLVAGSGCYVLIALLGLWVVSPLRGWKEMMGSTLSMMKRSLRASG